MTIRLYTKAAIGLAIAIGASSCTNSVADMTCNDVESEAVRISEGDLIKVIGGRETSRSETRLVCHGNGIYSDNTEIRTRYQAYLDEEGEYMISFDSDEQINHDVARAEQQIEAETARAQRELEQEMANTLRQVEQSF